jgi:hypothetical protein
MSEEELAELAEVEPAFVERAVRAGALQGREAVGGFGIQDAAGFGSSRPGTPPD